MGVSAFPQSLIMPDRPFRILDSYTKNTLYSDRSLWLDSQKILPDGPPPFDSFHYWYYADNARVPAVETARQQTILDHGCIELAQAGQPLLYRPFSITGGIYSHQLAITFDHRQVFDIAGRSARLRTTRQLNFSQIGRERLVQDVINQNKRDAEYLNQRLFRAFPDYALVDPFDKEGAMRVNRLESDAGFGRPPEEEDFMGGWYRLVDHAQGMIWTPNVAFSRNGNWEEMRGVFAAIGSLNGIVRNTSGYKFYRIDRSYCPFAERLQFNLDYLLFAAENEFHASEAATCAAWKLEIAKRLLDKNYNMRSYHPIDVNAIDPMLYEEFYGQAGWALICRERIAELREALEPLLLHHFVGHIRTEHMRPLHKIYHDARAKKNRNFKGFVSETAVVSDAQQRLQDLNRYRAAEPTDPVMVVTQTPAEPIEKLPQAFRSVATQRQLAHVDNVFDTDKYGSKLFEDNYYSRLTKREQIVLQRIMGAMLTVVLPLHKPAYTCVWADLEKGTHSLKAAKAWGVNNLNQLREVIGDPKQFVEQVEQPNMRDVKALVEVLQADDVPVLSTLQLLGIQQAYVNLPHITAVHGYGPTSPAFRMALRLKWMDMMADRVVLQEDWAVSEDQVEHVVRATLIQLGLVPRGHLHAHNLVLQDHNFKPMNFLDRFMPIMDRLAFCVEHNIEARTHVCAALRLIECHEVLTDPSIRPGLIDVNAVHETLVEDRLRFRPRAQLDATYQKARAFIMSHCVDWLDEQDLRDLNKDVRDAWQKLQQEKLDLLTPDLTRASFAVRSGFGPPRP